MQASLSLIFFLIFAHSSFSQDVHIMTIDNYETILSSFDYVLIDFYLPWCAPCQLLAPHFSKAASKLKNLKKSIALAQVNANEQQALINKFTILEYPTLKFFAVGIELHYKGGDTEDEIYKWMRFRAISSTKLLNSLEHVEEVTVNNDMIIIYFGENGSSFEVYEKVTKTYDNLNFAHFFEPDNENIYNQDSNKVVLIKKEMKFIYNPDQFNFNELRAFINRHQKGVILPLDKYNAYKIFEQGKPGLILLLDDSLKSDQALEDLRNALNDPEINEQFISYNGDYKQDFSKTFMELFGIKNEDLPQIRIMKPQKFSKNVDKYEPPNPANLSQHQIIVFCKLFSSGLLKKIIKSQPIPKENNEKVRGLVGNTFEAVVFDEKKDVLVNFYAPWCNHCQQFEHIYRDLAEKIAFNPNILLTKIDASQNEIDNIVIREYPTIKFFPAKAKTNPIDYRDNRDFQSLLNFLQKHSSFSWPSLEPNYNEPLELTEVNFDDIVYKSNEAVLVNFYATPCGFCRQLDPTYKELVKKIKELGLDLTIARIDSLKNKINKIKIRGFPSVLLFPKNDKEHPINYEGDRSLEDFLRFIKENCVIKEKKSEKEEKIMRIEKQNFKEQVYNENNDFLLIIYKNKMEKFHEEIIDKLIDFFEHHSHNVLFGKIDIGKQQFPEEISYQIDINDLPNIAIFIRQYKRSPIQFNGDMSNFEDIKKFILKESSFTGMNSEKSTSGEEKNKIFCNEHQCKEDL